VKAILCSLLVGLSVAAATSVVHAAPAADPHKTDSHAADSHAGGGHDDHAHGIGHGDPSTDPSEVKGDLAIFSAVVFLLLVVILRKFAWGPIAAGLEKREHHIHEHIAGAERANAEAKAMLVEYQKKLEAAHLEVRGILDEARRDAEHTKQEIVAAARAEAASEMERGKREVHTAMDQALKYLAESSAEQAVYLAGKVLQQQLKPADHTRLIDEAMAKLPRGPVQFN